MATFDFVFEKTTVQRVFVTVETDSGEEVASHLAKDAANKKVPWVWMKETIETIGGRRRAEEPDVPVPQHGKAEA